LLQRRPQRLPKGGQGAERYAQLREVARPRRAQRNPGQYPFEIANGAQHLGQRHVTHGIDERRDRVIANPQRGVVAKRPMQPAAQQTAAHGGGGAIEYAGQGEFRSAGKALIEFEIASRCGIHDESGIAFFGGDGQQMRQRCFLRLAHVGEQRARRGYSQRFVGAAEARQIVRAKLFGQSARRRFGVEMPGRAQAPGAILISRRGGQGGLRTVRRQDFRGTQTLDFRLERGQSRKFHHAESAGR